MVVAVAGEADMFTAPRLQAAVGETLADPDVEVTVIDLTDVEFVDQG
jgi:anti-anti-sigma regulatory factor